VIPIIKKKAPQERLPQPSKAELAVLRLGKVVEEELNALHYRLNVYVEAMGIAGVLTPELIKQAQGNVDARNKILEDAHPYEGLGPWLPLPDCDIKS
jgi:hypothetical protein